VYESDASFATSNVEKLGGCRANSTFVVTAPSTNRVTNRHEVWPFATEATTFVTQAGWVLFARRGVAHGYDTFGPRSPRAHIRFGFSHIAIGHARCEALVELTTCYDSE